MAVVGSHNKHAFANKFVNNAAAPLKNHLIVCGYQYDEDSMPTRAMSETITSIPVTGKVKLSMQKPVFDPPLQGGDMAIEVYWKQGASATKHSILPGNVSIPKPRVGNDQVEVTLPTGLIPSVTNPIEITVQCKAADGPYLGESFGKNSLVVYDSSDVADYNDTITHEIGHAFNQTPPAGSEPATTPEHPNWFSGQGTHCNNGHKKCVMYEDGPNATAIHKYCEVCHPYLLVEDMSKF